jgi:chromosome partitioning protein
MKKIVVLNPKGGSGKTTIATNLAAYYATQGLEPTLMDMDRQGSSMHWLSKRFADLPVIHGIAAFENPARVTKSWQMRIRPESRRIIVDTPAAIDPQLLPEITRGAQAILIPVVPSDIDIYAATNLIRNLLLVARIRRSDGRIGVLANRVKSNTLIYQSLMRFLRNLRIPIVGVLRDSQVYVRCAEQGIGIHELQPHQVRKDLDQWKSILSWEKGRPSNAMNSVGVV